MVRKSLESILAPTDVEIDAAIFPETDVVPENIDHIPADDTVSLYFRQMASEPLLTAEQEVVLAKRIERGNKAQEMLESKRRISKEERAWAQTAVRDGQAARSEEHTSELQSPTNLV